MDLIISQDGDVSVTSSVSIVLKKDQSAKSMTLLEWYSFSSIDITPGTDRCILVYWEDEVGGLHMEIFFPGKPEPAMIAALKSSAFKWSPSRGCWQRQLTGNAKDAARRVLASTEIKP